MSWELSGSAHWADFFIFLILDVTMTKAVARGFLLAAHSLIFRAMISFKQIIFFYGAQFEVFVDPELFI